MIVHIADAEISALLDAYVKTTGLSQTEAIRHLLRNAVQQEQRSEAKQKFREIAYRIVEKNRGLNIPPVSKEEADSLFED